MDQLSGGDRACDHGTGLYVFPDVKERWKEGQRLPAYFNEGARDIDDNKTMTFGGKMMLSAYHIGSHITINEMPAKRFSGGADNHGYKCEIPPLRDT